MLARAAVEGSKPTLHGCDLRGHAAAGEGHWMP